MELGQLVTLPDPEVFDPVTRPSWFDGSNVSAKSSKLVYMYLVYSRTVSRRHTDLWPDPTKIVDLRPGDVVLSLLQYTDSISLQKLNSTWSENDSNMPDLGHSIHKWYGVNTSD